MEPDEFSRQVRDALEHLYEPVHLETHPLLSLVAGQPASDSLTRAQKLRGLLKEAIEALRPQQGTPSTSPAWRGYQALRYRYVQGMSPGEVADELGLSLRQVQRELRKGLDALTALLWQRLQDGAAPPPPSQPAQELRQELDQWQLSRQPWDVQALVDDTLWMLKPRLGHGGPRVQVELPPSLPPALADSTLARQALFQVLRLLVQGAGQGTVTLRAYQEGRRVHLVLEAPSPLPQPSHHDWQTALLLVSQQGASLSAQSLGKSGARVTLSLPQASQARVLVIDDNRAIHQLFERYLLPNHYEVIHAYQGQEALRLAAEEQPDLITLDVMMPNLDGWRVLRDLAQNPATAHIPVVVCSVLSEPELALALGARAYLKKPVDRLQLLETLARIRPPGAPAEAVPPPTPSEG